MNKYLCLFPKDGDGTTEFLRPVYDLICTNTNVTGFDNDALDDDEYFEELESLLKTHEGLIFLGHGSRTTLYGTKLNPIIDDKSGNLPLLKGKKLLLFSCMSSDFIKNYHLHDAIGFGFIPTSKDDAHDGAKLHGLSISCLEYEDLHYFQEAIVRIWTRILSICSWEQIDTFYKNFSFFTNIEIVEVLTRKKDLPNYRLVADMLYYLVKDMRYEA